MTGKLSRPCGFESKTHLKEGALSVALIVVLAIGFSAAGVAKAEERLPVNQRLLDSSSRPGERLRMDRPDSTELKGERVPGRYIVVLENSVEQPASVARAQTESRNGELGLVYSHALKGYSAELSKTAVRELRNAPNVKYVTPVLKAQGTAQSIPTGISRTFASTNSALDIDEIDDARINVDVAVIDSGIDQNHSDLNMVARTDCTIGCVNGAGTDEAGHGTHVAGTIGAIDNSSGVAGMAPGARLWSVRVLDASNSGTSEWIIAGLDWVTARASEIEVANMSFAGEGREPAIEEAIDKAIDKGVVFAVAAGNSTWQAERFWPANDPDVITVSAIADYDGQPGEKGSPTCVWMGDDDDLGWYSNWGDVVDIAAPGTCILSSVPGGGYASYYGTSMASPHVAGAAAVLASKSNPSNRTGVEALRNQLVDEASLNWTDTSGDNSYEPLLYAGEKALATSEAKTAGFSNTDGTTVVLDGAVSTHGLETEYQFEYGTTTAYGSEAPATPKKISGSEGYVEVSEAIPGLKHDQTYHYRLMATSSSGTVYGEDRTFVPSRWIKDDPERVSSFEWMYDTSCVAGGQCMAVGYAYHEETNNQASYQYDNGKWTYKALPIPAEGWSPEPIGVSCTAANACTAVGHYFKGSDVKVLVERWNGSSWSLETVPSPYSEAPFTRGRSVSCVSGSECIAVGSYVNPSGVLKNWSGQLKGGSWSNLTTPSMEGAEEAALEDVSCSSASFCMAVGWAYDEGVGYKPVSLAWNGTSWETRTPARTSGTSGSVSCTSSTFCMTAGYGLSSEVWNGEKWVYKDPAPAFWGYFTSVYCGSPSYCTAVGGAKGLKYFGIAEVWNGSSWKLLPPSMDGEVVHGLNGVSCAGLSGCTAVGEFSVGSAEGLFEHRDEVVTGPASSLAPAKATVSGTVNPGSLSTSYYFEYGPTTGYGSKAPASEEGIGSGTTPVDVTEELTELEPETLYHYRVVATNTNEKGQKVTAYGKDRTFRTPGSVPTFSSSVGSFGTGNGQFHTPLGVAVDSSGNIWVADAGNHRVQKFNSKGEYQSKFGSFGTGNGQFHTPAGIAIASNGDLLVTDSGNGRVQRFNSKGEYQSKFATYGTGDGQLVEPGGIAIDSSGTIWVVDHSYYRVVEFNSKGEYVRTIRGSGWSGGSGPEIESPTGVAIDPEGHVWVTDLATSKVLEYSSTGTYLSQFGEPGVDPGELAEPGAIAFEAGKMWIGDRSGRVQKFMQSGEHLAELGGLSEPGGIAIAPGGVLWITSTIYVDRLEKWQMPVPSATTNEAANVVNTQAELKGSVNPNGLLTKYRFEYGTTTSYGSSVPISDKAVGSGTSPVSVAESLSGLSPGQTYHFRLAATNYYGTTYGVDQVFTTLVGIADKLAGMAVTEAFNGGTTSISNFSTDWSALGWASGSPAKGENTASGWRAVAGWPTVNGASYSSALTDTGAGLAAAATMAANPNSENRHFSIWLDMPTPSGTKAGYELKFTYVSANTYNVALNKWQSGSSTTLASKSSYSFVNGNSFALVDSGASVSAWTNTGSGFSQLLSASDSTFSSGSVGVEASGNITRLTNFKVGSLLAPVASMDVALKELALNSSFGTNEDPLSGGGAWAGLFWDNSTSGHNTGTVSGGWGPYDVYPTVNGAYWTKAAMPDTGSGAAVAATLQARPAFTPNRYFSIWLEMPSPASAKTGYEARFTETSANTYEVVLSKWQAGTKTGLATKTGYSFPVGNQFALVDKGATVAIWTKTGTEYSQLLSASDSTFKTGYTGVEGSGSSTRLKDFRSGPLAPF